MSEKLSIGDEVYVPFTKLGEDASGHSALCSTKILAINKKNITVNNPRSKKSCVVYKPFIHKRFGICILRIGDFGSEESLLDPLAAALTNYIKLLIPSEFVYSTGIRTTEELCEIVSRTGDLYTIFVLVGHGNDISIKFGSSDFGEPSDITSCFESSCKHPKLFISLCCKTGRRSFAKEFSSSRACSYLIAPPSSLHAAQASNFFQCFFWYHLFNGHSVHTSVKKTHRLIPEIKNIRLWQKGLIVKT